MKQAIVTSVLVAGLALGAMESAYAAKGGNSTKSSGGKQQTTSATLNSECEASCYPGEVVRFTGSGYDASQGQALLKIGAGLYSAVAVASDGTVDFVWNYFQIPGDYSVQLYQEGRGNKQELKAQVTVTIYEP